MLTWEALGHAMALPADEVQQRAIIALIEATLTQLNQEEIVLIQTYGLLSASELEQAMQAGQVPEHPAWEDLIHWEAIEDRRKALKESLKTESMV